MTFYSVSMDLLETQTALLHIDRFLDQHHALGQPPWKLTPYSGMAPKRFSATGAKGTGIMQKIVPRDHDQVGELEQQEEKDVMMARGVTP